MKRFTRQERIEYWTEQVVQYQKALERDGNKNTESLLEYAEGRLRDLVQEQLEVETRLSNYKRWIKKALGS